MSLLRERRRCPLIGALLLLIRSSPGSPQSTGARHRRARTLFGVKPAGGGYCIPGFRNAPKECVRTQTLSIKLTAPSVGIQSPSFPSGIPPPRGIGGSPRIMHDIRRCDTLAYRGALAYFERRALLAEIPARGEEFGARKLKPVSTRLYGVAKQLLRTRAIMCLTFGAALKERAATFKRRLRRL